MAADRFHAARDERCTTGVTARRVLNRRASAAGVWMLTIGSCLAFAAPLAAQNDAAPRGSGHTADAGASREGRARVPAATREALVQASQARREAPVRAPTFLRYAPADAPPTAQDPWPASCRDTRETIFDRVVRITDTLAAVPEVPRLEDSLGIRGRYVDLGDMRLWVEETGAGPPLLLISGGPGTSHHYFHPHLIPAARFARLIYVDLRGVGRSDYEPGDGYTVAQAVADLERLRRRLGLERWTLFGYSFGGTVAQLYTIRHPERVAGLVLASSAVPMDLDVGLRTRERDFMAPEEIDRVAEIYRVDGEPVVPAHGDRVDPATQRSMVYNGFLNGDWKRRHLCRMLPAEIAHFARYEWVHDRNYYFEMVRDAQRYDLTGVFAENPIPTLILEGKWDLAFGEHKASTFAEQFPGARLVVFDDGGHTFFEDVPARFFETLRAFVTGLRPASRAAIARWKTAVERMTLHAEPATSGTLP